MPGLWVRCQVGVHRKATSRCFSLIDVSLPLFLTSMFLSHSFSLPSPLCKFKNLKKCKGIRTTMRYHSTSTRMALIKKAKTSVGSMWRLRALTHCCLEYKTVQPLGEPLGRSSKWLTFRPSVLDHSGGYNRVLSAR